MIDGPIRTLHLLTSLHRRGAETFAVQMIDRLDRERFSPHIWPARPAGPDGLVPERTPVLRGGADSTPRALRGLVRSLRTVRPHLVQCHGGAALKLAVAAKPFWRPRAYVYNKILSIHPHLDHPVKRSLFAFLIEQVDAIVGVGEEIRREVEVTFHPRRARLVTIRNGRDVRPFLAVTPAVAAETRRALGLAAGDICLMQVGIAWEKDPLVSLRAFAELAPAHPELRLVFVGEGPLQGELAREAAARGLGGRVHVLGVRRDVPALLSAADVLVLPSITEGLPGVLIEAGMAGCAAVAYDTGSVRDVLIEGVTGYIVPLGDTTALTARLREVVRDGALRRQMGREAMARCRGEFDIEASVRKYESLFAELVGESAEARSIQAAPAMPTLKGGDAWPGS